MKDTKNRTETGQKSRFGKDHVKYWRERLRKRIYTHNGRTNQIAEWQTRIQHAGKESWFNLGTSNRNSAAEKARDIYLFVRANGMAAAIERFKDKPLPKQESPTVGDFVSEVRKTAPLDPRTAALYIRKFRTIVAGIYHTNLWESESPEKRSHSYRKLKTEKWRHFVDSKKLSEITPTKIRHWAHSYVQKRGDTPIRRKRAEHTVNSHIRNARALFSPKILRSLDGIQLPSPLPFEGVELFRGGSMRYRSQIDPFKLLEKARDELATPHPEQFKALLLCLLLGLRRREADLLTWDSILWEQRLVRIDRNDHFSPKQESSLGDVPVEQELLELLRYYYERRKGPFVLESKKPPRPDSRYPYYRAEEHFKGLIGWLRKNGVDFVNPIHTLRKEFGRLICEAHGIYAASRLLRHSNITITAAHYADDKREIVTGLGKHLGNKQICEESKVPAALDANSFSGSDPTGGVSPRYYGESGQPCTGM